MNWNDVQTAWHELGDQIQENWPETQAADLMRIAGDKPSFARHLSKVHELTNAEAEEAIEDWLIRLRYRRTGPAPMDAPR
jgi:hypothetical protein